MSEKKINFISFRWESSLNTVNEWRKVHIMVGKIIFNGINYRYVEGVNVMVVKILNLILDNFLLTVIKIFDCWKTFSRLLADTFKALAHSARSVAAGVDRAIGPTRRGFRDIHTGRDTFVRGQVCIFLSGMCISDEEQLNFLLARLGY